jgi:SPP1 family phage portal protein
VWDEAQTYFFVQEDDGQIIEDESQEINPRPHTIFKKDGDDSTYYEGYGFIRFFRLDNCKKQFSGLKPIKDLIDSYDLMNCGLANNIQDTNESLYVVKGFQGDNLDELMVNIKTKKHIGVDEDGGVEIKTIDIPVEARKTKMEIDEKNIYRFGQALNTAGLKDTTATTNLAIKAAYSLLDLKVNKLEIRLKQFMRKLLKVILKEINDLNGTDFQQKDVYFCFDREIPTNAQENAQVELIEAQRKQTEITTLLNLANNLDDETRMQLICEQLDIDYNEIKDKLPKPGEVVDPYAPQSALDAIQTEDDVDGGRVIE